jgi:hypothetical protein
MDLGKRLSNKMDDVFSFYTSSTHKNDAIKIIHNAQNHRFLIYSKALNFVWMPAYVGSAVVSLFDDGQYNDLKIKAMESTLWALVGGNIFFGAFWAKLGSYNLLKDSWKKSKKETCKQVALNSLRGQVYNYYYDYKVASEIYDKFSLDTLGVLGKINPSAARGIEALSGSMSRIVF